jgi:hypothetical protein
VCQLKQEPAAFQHKKYLEQRTNRATYIPEKKLDRYRQGVLPLIHSNSETLSEMEQRALSNLHNFYCGLPIMVHFAELVIKRVLEKNETA